MKICIVEETIESIKNPHIVEMNHVPRVGDSIYHKQQIGWTVVEVIWCIEPEDRLFADVWIKVGPKEDL
jgi:hypothetical protein